MNLVPHETYSKIPKILFDEFPLLNQTLRLIRVAHGKQLYNGQPYFHHPIRIALRMNWHYVEGPDLYGALLHDTLEDTDLTVDDLEFFGYDKATIYVTKCLTREKDGDQTYKEYIQNLLKIGDFRLIRIKLCDLYENSNNVRFLPPEKRKILIKYGRSITEIQEFLSRTDMGKEILEHTISGELDKETLEAWIKEEPKFL